MHCELLVLLGRIWSKKFSYLEVTLEGTEIARAGGEGPCRRSRRPPGGRAGSPSGRGQDEEDDRSRVAAGKEKSACAREEKKVVGSGVDGR